MNKLTFQITVFLLCLISFSINVKGQKPSAEKIDMTIRKHTDESIQDLLDFLSIPNDAFIPEQLEENIDWCYNAFSAQGFMCERLETGAIDVLFAERKFEGAQSTILFYVQIDGQPVDRTKWFQETPFTPTMKTMNSDGDWDEIPAFEHHKIDKDWRLFARSASDAKGPIVMFLAAIRAMNELGIQPNYNIKIIFDTEEEIGSPNLPRAVQHYKKKLAADALVILDGPMHISNKPTLVFGARGISTLRLTTYGPRVPQHSGHYGNYVPNPALHMATLLSSMKDEEGKVVIPGYYDGISISEEVMEILKQVPDDEDEFKKLIGFAQPDGVGSFYQESIQYPSLNIRGLQAAWVGTKVRTIIPHTAVANIDIRTVIESDPDRLVGLVIEHIEDQGFHIVDLEPTEEERMKYNRLISLNSKVAYQAFRTDFNAKPGVWLDKALTNCFGSAPIKIRTHGGSIPISPFVNTLELPAVIVPLVNSDNNQHSPNENVRMGNYFDGVKTCFAILMEAY